MRAIQVVERTGPDGVRVRQIPEPGRRPDEVLVQVRAAGVTFPDLLISHGKYQESPDLPFVLGGEFAGIVREAPADSSFAPGDRVTCSSAHCAFAELAAVPYERVLPLPAHVSFEVGACLPANYLTMLFGFLQRGRLRPGERVLVHGASGGVGVASVQLARALRASQVIAVTSNPSPALESADVIPASGFVDTVAAMTNGAGVDIVVDPVGGDRLAESIRCLAPGGRALIIGFASGTIPTIDVNLTQDPGVDLVGVGWGSHLAHHPEALGQEWDRLMQLTHAHPYVRPSIDRILRLEEAADALRALESRQAHGRLVLCP